MRWWFLILSVSWSGLCFCDNTTLDAASGISSSLLNAAQQSVGSASVATSLADLGVSVSSVGDGLSSADSVRGVTGAEISAFSFSIPPACELGETIHAVGLSGTPLKISCESPSNGLISMQACLQLLAGNSCNDINYIELSLPTDGQSITQQGIDWQGTCNDAGVCQGVMQLHGSVTANSTTIDTQANATLDQNSAYQTVKSGYNVQTISQLNSLSSTGSQSSLVSCMDDTTTTLESGVVQSCNGQNETTFSSGCHVVNTCQAYEDQTITEHYQQVCTIRSATKSVQCIETPHIDLMSAPQIKTDSFSGNLTISGSLLDGWGQHYALVAPKTGTIQSVVFHFGAHQSGKFFFCDSTYSATLNGVAAGTGVPENCNDLSVSGNNLNLAVSAGDTLSLDMNPFMYWMGLDDTTYTLSIETDETEIIPVVSWEEVCE